MPATKLKSLATRRPRKIAVTSTKASDNRVTVRLKPELAEKLAEARRAQGLSVTQIIEAALEKHLAPVPKKPKLTLLEALEKHGLLGTVDLPADASVNYKKYVGEYLDKKYPQHRGSR